MHDSVSKKLAFFVEIFNEGTIEEGFQLIKDIEKMENLTPEETLTVLINTFSSEIFSISIDRIKIGENTILINPIEPFLACYIIKGQSNPAQQNLSRFSDTVKATSEIWDIHNKAGKTSEMLEMDNPTSLGSTVNEIFIGF
ncbi:MAG: hypothetical protein ACTSO6_10255 [Promethearchaeota archaeon]